MAIGCNEPPPSEAPEALAPPPGHSMPTAESEPQPQLSDAGITHAIERHLLFDRLTPSYRINVETRDGIVELTGSVDNLLAQVRATRIAEAIKGVRSVSNRLTIEAKPVHDTELVANVDKALLYDPATASYEIEVAAKDGKITLTGTVDSWAEKKLAEQVASSVRGVETLDNQITIEYGARPSDTELARDIQELLAQDVLVERDTIEVTVHDGEAKLTGKVGSAAERARAKALAWTAGVSEVDDEGLTIDWLLSDFALREQPNRHSAAQIERAIEDAAKYDPRVLSFEIRPAVTGNTVTLHGIVDNLAAKRAAEQLARNTVGVAEVINEIEVKPKTDLEDEAITDSILSRLLTNVYTDSYEIGVNVEEGVVTLTGTVDSYFDKAEAGELASHAHGVLFVRNLLQVRHPEVGYYFDPYLYPYHPYVEYWHTFTPPSTAKSDEDIALAVEDELFWNPWVDEGEVHVSVKNGTAILTGTVDSWRERAAATRSAYEGGALFVDNLLHVAL
jgi:osmotically-inducible protein OsmY